MSIISIIIPVYNAEKTIESTINSVLNQTFIDFELIVINDGSTDSTLEIVHKITDPRLKVFSYANANQAASRNRGIAKATGEYIAFLDADDLWTPDKLESQINMLKNNSEHTSPEGIPCLFINSGNTLEIKYIVFSEYVLPIIVKTKICMPPLRRRTK